MKLRHDGTGTTLTVFNVRKPLIELTGVTEHFGEQKVEQSPELVKVVLKRRPGDQHAVVRRKRSKDDGKTRIFILQAVRFVDDDVTPMKLLQRSLLLDDHFVRRHAHVETARHQKLGLLRLALFGVSVKLERANHRTPTLKLVHPVTERGFRHDNHVRSGNTPVFGEVTEKRNRLQRLPETHLVRQDAVDAVIEQSNHPVQTRNLVLSHLAKLNARRLRRQTHRLVILSVFHELGVLRLLRRVALVAPALALVRRLVRRLRPRQKVREDLGLRQQKLPLPRLIISRNLLVLILSHAFELHRLLPLQLSQPLALRLGHLLHRRFHPLRRESRARPRQSSLSPIFSSRARSPSIAHPSIVLVVARARSNGSTARASSPRISTISIPPHPLLFPRSHRAPRRNPRRRERTASPAAS